MFDVVLLFVEEESSDFDNIVSYCFLEFIQFLNFWNLNFFQSLKNQYVELINFFNLFFLFVLVFSGEGIINSVFENVRDDEQEVNINEELCRFYDFFQEIIYIRLLKNEFNQDIQRILLIKFVFLKEVFVLF